MTKRKRRFKPPLSRSAKSAADTVAQSAKTVGDATVQGAKSAGEAATEGVKVAGSAAVQGAKVAGDVVGQGAKSAGDTATQAGKVAGSAANQGIRVAGGGIEAIRNRAPSDFVSPERIRNNLAGAIESSTTLSGSAKRNLIAQLGPTLHRLSENGAGAQTQAFAMIQAVLAHPRFPGTSTHGCKSIVEGSATIYDKAMDARFIETGMGGGYHRLFDGGHTLWGAFQAVRDASPDDSVFEEAMGLLQALARDATTPRGLP